LNELIDRVSNYIKSHVAVGAEEFDSGRILSINDSSIVARAGLLEEYFHSDHSRAVKALTTSIIRVSAHCGNLRNLFLVNFGMVGRLLHAVRARNITFNDAVARLIRGEMIGALAMTESRGGSNPRGFITRLSKSKSGLLLDGEKTWITLGSIANFYIVQAWLNDVLVLIYVPADSKGISVSPIKALGARGSGLSLIRFDRVTVDEAHILPEFLTELNNTSTVDYLLRSGRYYAGASALGMGLSALHQTTITLSQRRNQKGPLIYQGDWESRISELYMMSVLLKKCTSNLQSTVFTQGSDIRPQETPFKILSTRFAIECTELLVKASGAEGYRESSFANRLFRESIAGEFIEGGNTVLTIKSGQDWMRAVLTGDIYAPF
jgi:alkylation response protein AidB-like acyl-CoA dehydrogenase